MHSEYSLPPFWYDEVDFSAKSQNEQSLPSQAEVLIVGGGFTGLSAALTLGRAGKQVVLVDARQWCQLP